MSDISLLEIYKDKNRHRDWFNKHSSLGKGATGRMFEYINTNFRTQDSFMAHFKKFLEVENKPRETWTRQNHHGQELDKQRVMNMIESKLFKKDVSELYSRTEKGFLYNKFIDSDIPQKEKWLINYLFLINGYYSKRRNYIIYRVKEDLLNYLKSVEGVTEEMLIKEAKELINIDSSRKMLRNPFFFFHSFYDDSDFLIRYLRASHEEKEELAKYIEGNLSKRNFVCCLSKKYQPSGNFNLSMLVDEVKVFLLTLLFLQSKDANLIEIYKIFVKNFKLNISDISDDIVFDYLYKNKNIFDPIFIEILELEDREITAIDSVDEPKLEIEDKPEVYIDETSEVGKQKIKKAYSMLKRQARMHSNFRCGLETINNCRPIYFTAKVTGKNYLEVHHLIPREFRNDFPYSIEVLANYVALCPRCHRQIHLATDRERKHLINSLYGERENRLQIVGLKLDLKGLYEYYKIDS